MSKWNKENVLYFASTKKSGFEVSKDAVSQVELRKLVSKLKASGLLVFAGSCRFKNLYKITEKGKITLNELQCKYKESKRLEIEETISKDDLVNTAGYYVYFGYDSNNELVYIGTTIQKPADRWRWHKHNGKDLIFEIHESCRDADEMLSLEFELIKKHNPKLNKIAHRKQNLNVKLTKEQLSNRVGVKEWCQSCLRRRVKKGSSCGYCK